MLNYYRLVNNFEFNNDQRNKLLVIKTKSISDDKHVGQNIGTVPELKGYWVENDADKQLTDLMAHNQCLAEDYAVVEIAEV